MPVRARIFTAIVKKPDVIVQILQWFDYPLDEVVQFNQIISNFFGYIEIHPLPPARFRRLIGKKKYSRRTDFGNYSPNTSLLMMFR